MGFVIFILILALLFGGLGLFVEALWWMLIIAGALFLLGAITGVRARRY